MKKNITVVFSLLVLLTAAAQLAQAQQPAFQDDELTPELFSLILKDEWTYMREATDQLIQETGNRDEFETTAEFHVRAAKSRKTFMEKLNAHIKDTRLEKRTFGVWFKATLVRYDADAKIYSLQSPTKVEAPYEIPTAVCAIPKNNLVGISDSIKGGYRQSQIYLKFNPDFKWKVARNDAVKAKGSEKDIYFKVNFVINLSLDNAQNRGIIRIVPKELLIMNQLDKYIYHKQNIVRTE
ncbi:MAG: hypothetical protein JXA06_05510 [Bacteroidetes bacterium]|nr:hypothetical protein [Bacteroidota bacterium]